MNKVKLNKQMYDKEKMYKNLVILCWLTILVCTILKLFGSKEFEMPEYTYNINIWIRRVINYIFYMINSVAFAMLLVKRKLEVKEYIVVFSLYTPLFVIGMVPILRPFKFVLETLFLYFIGLLYIKDKWWKILIEVLTINVIIFVYQALTMMYKNINVKIKIDNFIIDKIMMIDYYIMIILTYLFVNKKGGYIYGRWNKFLVAISKRKRNGERLQLCEKTIQKESITNKNLFLLFTIMVSVFQIVFVFTLCYFINNTTWQIVIVFTSFCVMRKVFGKSYHCKTIINCTSLSCLAFVIATRLSLPPYISTLCNVIIGSLVAYMMYILYYYDKYTNSQGITLSRGMSLEALMKMCSDLQLNKIEEKIMVDYYVNRKTLQNIAISLGYSEDNVKKLKAKIIKRISD